ncbi:MAG TPA: N-acetylmuramoyl-L-alanine amidase, partial [Lachnospiraceae bacterium]|nr:N-acetylmuramoyl-L-alanine amidase [Lachnospiraceae bacterium]
SSTYKSPNGTEILYYNHENNNIKTKDLANIFSEEISNNISLKNNGLIQMRNKEVFILNNATVPAIIIETGYMSAPRDLDYLNSEYGQQTIVKGIYSGIWRAYEELIPSK